ncbi:MAG: AmmeMemoRadiSam system radical SAM enzyme [Fibrobacteria bacterium]|nr:AmmeMemoRadiSam system radical SAM enzyme [Fibrobacteria bacterium]
MLEDGRIECRLCPRLCRIKEGQRGFCFVRQHIHGKLILTTYGRSSGFQLDPIEKKPLYHFYPGTSIISFGTAGCNLGCSFCQNWDLSRSQSMDRMQAEALPAEIARLAKRRNCPSVAFTYNEPIIFSEYAIDAAKACRELSIHTVAVTAGYITHEAGKDFFSSMDAANVDLKGFTEQFYHTYCKARLQPVLDTLMYIKNETDTWLEITNLLIPGANDSEQELHAMTDWIVSNLGTEVPLHFSAFHPAFTLQSPKATPLWLLQKARTIALSKGIRYVYLGNVDDPGMSDTVCPGCGSLLVERSGYSIGHYGLNGNQCGQCRQEIPGLFKG